MGKSGGAVAHGFTHDIQKLQFVGTELSWGNAPSFQISEEESCLLRH